MILYWINIMKEKMTVENFIVGFQNGLWYFTKEKKKAYAYGTLLDFTTTMKCICG